MFKPLKPFYTLWNVKTKKQNKTTKNTWTKKKQICKSYYPTSGTTLKKLSDIWKYNCSLSQFSLYLPFCVLKYYFANNFWFTQDTGFTFGVQMHVCLGLNILRYHCWPPFVTLNDPSWWEGTGSMILLKHILFSLFDIWNVNCICFWTGYNWTTCTNSLRTILFNLSSYTRNQSIPLPYVHWPYVI